MSWKLFTVVFLVAAMIFTYFASDRPDVPNSNGKISIYIDPSDRAVHSQNPNSRRKHIPASAQFKNTSFADKTRELARQIHDLLNSGDLNDRDRASNQLLAELIEMDARASAALAESLPPDSPERKEMLWRVAQHWAETDITRARHWAEKLSNEEERAAALMYVCGKMAQTDPQLAVRMADGYGLKNSSGPVLADLVLQWSEHDFPSAFAWVQARPASDEKYAMLGRLAEVLAQTAPAEAAQIVAGQIPAGPVQTEAAISVLHRWSRDDLAASRAWVELFPEGALRERALKELNSVAQ